MIIYHNSWLIHSLIFFYSNDDLSFQNTQLLGGIPRLIEPVMGTNFHVGPFTNFISNIGTAQSMYQAFCDLIQPTANTTLVDICSGIGAVGLCLAKVNNLH